MWKENKYLWERLCLEPGVQDNKFPKYNSSSNGWNY